MEMFKKERKVLRTLFTITRNANELERLLSDDEKSSHLINVVWEIVQQKYAAIQVVDEKIYEGLLEENVDEAVLVDEIEVRDNYFRKYIDLKLGRQRFALGSDHNGETVSQVSSQHSVNRPTGVSAQGDQEISSHKENNMNSKSPMKTDEKKPLNQALSCLEKIPHTEENPSLVNIALLVKDDCVANLWKLDVLDITDPVETKSRDEKAFETKQMFKQTVTENEEGRYEVRLPWLDGHPSLPSNYLVAKKRLESTLRLVFIVET